MFGEHSRRSERTDRCGTPSQSAHLAAAIATVLDLSAVVGRVVDGRSLTTMEFGVPMKTLRIWIILSWIALPTVMFGGYSLLRLLNRGDLTQFQASWFRAGHAHAGVLLLLSLLYYLFLDQTALAPVVKRAGSAALFVGILAQSGGFFVHMIVGRPDGPSIGTFITNGGTALLATAVIILIYGLLATR